ncbi:MAG: UDP-N-acetylmuramoyl-L-alanine--D-glutamate ligase [Anaerolineae bacterium]
MKLEVEGRRVVVLGLARQGTALARWLAGQGAQVTVSDAKPASALGDALRFLEGLSIRFELGGHPLSLLDQCDLLCLSGGVPIDRPIVIEALKRGVPLANDAQLFVERCPATIIGITGSAGKTTTTALVGEMARSAGPLRATQERTSVWVGGNIGNPLIGDLNSIAKSDVVVMELSSFQLEIMTSSPPVAAVLNVTPNHLDRHPSMEAYIAAKARILDFQSPQDTAVLGYDDPVARSLASRVRGKVRFFAGDSPLRSAAGIFESRLPHTGVKDGHVVLVEGRAVRVCALSDIRLRGDHNVLNVLAACALADAVGIPTEAMREAIIGFRGVAHRLQRVRELNGVTYYDDSIATAPERLVAAIQAFHEPIVLLAGGRDKHLPWTEAAEVISRRVRQLILFGEMAELVEKAVSVSATAPSAPLRGSSGAASHKLLEGVHRVESLADAVKKAAEVARPGDVVLLAPGGASFDAFKDFAERGDTFQEYVRAL